MNSPYMGRFQVTQEFKGSAHDGLDLVGLDSKDIHATVTGTVVYAGWENDNDTSQGFGQYVCIKSDNDGLYYYYGHMSKILTTTGSHVNICDTIGVEGDTGYSFGSHCHYCVRPEYTAGCYEDVTIISGIPNSLGIYDDGYRPNTGYNPAPASTVKVTVEFDDKTYSGLLEEM